jgi:hypothetical protein
VSIPDFGRFSVARRKTPRSLKPPSFRRSRAGYGLRVYGFTRESVRLLVVLPCNRGSLILTMTEESAITDKDKVTILLAEYNTLRAEMIQRYASTYQLFTLGTATAALVNLVTPVEWKWVVAAAALIILGSAFYIIRAGIRHLSAHVRTLEREINRKAKENLLTWESQTEQVREKYGTPELGRDLEKQATSNTRDESQI